MDTTISVAVFRLYLLGCNECLTRYKLNLDRERNIDGSVCCLGLEGHRVCDRFSVRSKDGLSGCLIVQSAFHDISLSNGKTLELNGIDQGDRLSESNDVSLCLRIGKSRLNDRIEVQELTTDTILRLPVNVIDCCISCGCSDLEVIRVRIFDIVLGSYCFLKIVLSDTKTSVLISLFLGILNELADDYRAILILIDSELST